MSDAVRLSTARREPHPDVGAPPRLQASSRSVSAAISKGVAQAKLPRAVEVLTKDVDRASAYGRRLDAFLEQCHPTFMVGGRAVRVPLHFASNYAGHKVVEDARVEIKKLLGDAEFSRLSHDISQATGTRGRPEHIARTVQALIDAGALETMLPGVEPQAAIRSMMFTLHLGLDCIGYSLAAAEYARGTGSMPKPAARLGFPDRSAVDFGAWKKVEFADARPGDVLHMPRVNGERQHNVIVRNAQRVAVKQNEKLLAMGREVPAVFTRGASSVQVFTVDSSWGGGERGDFGGAERRVFVLNPETKLWASWDARGQLEFGPAPGGHAEIECKRPHGEAS